MQINVVLIDDNEVVLRQMADSLERMPPVKLDGNNFVACTFYRLAPVCSDSGGVDIDATLRKAVALKPGVAVIDLKLGGHAVNDNSGADLALRIKERCRDCCIILASHYFDVAPALLEHMEIFRLRVDRQKMDYLTELQGSFTAAVQSHASAVFWRLQHRGTVKTRPLGTTSPSNAVYISYARDEKAQDEASREEIVHRIEESLRRHGYDVRRDQTSLGYGKRLIPFMKEFRRGGCIVAVISDKYLRSPYCMYELLQSYRNGGFDAKVCPVVLPDGTAISKPQVRRSYVEYWERQVHDYETWLQETNPSLLAKGSLDELGFYRDIARNADELILFLAGMNWLDPETLEENDFAVLRNRIDECLKQVPKRRVRGQG